MIAWLMIAQAVAVAVLGTVLLVAGFAKAKMADWVLVIAALVEVTLIVQVIASIIAPIAGNGPTGDLFEYWIYLVSALLIPPAAVIWGLIDRGRWSVVVIGVAMLSVAIMVYRMHQIWFIQVA
ncbi:hypothetical protein [Humidisolicoccus flavus]|uniref:hypothetical protein n=1 Tax=Humidisolicoccus flavus TaxID=3111414 RepID=UPI003248CBAF